jgi:hypothetical protein
MKHVESDLASCPEGSNSSQLWPTQVAYATKPQGDRNMKMHTECAEFTPALTKVMAVLMAAFLTAASTGCLAQAPPPATPPTTPAPAYATPTPSSLSAWIELDSQGRRNVYYLSSEGKVVYAGQLRRRGPPSIEREICPPNCVATPVGCMCD